nr:hypothetical protein [Tanacetum cinerariifolium]
LSDKQDSAVTTFAKALHGLEVISTHLAHDVVAKHGRGLGVCISAEILIQIDFVAFHFRAVAVAGAVKAGNASAARHTGSNLSSWRASQGRVRSGTKVERLQLCLETADAAHRRDRPECRATGNA